jgi:hypothetical protein
VGRPEWKRPLGRTRHRWECNIKMVLQEEGWRRMDWINLTEDRERRRALVDAVMNLKGSIAFGEILDQLRTSQLLRKDAVPWS